MSETRQTYPDKAQQGCTRQSLLPILGAQSLKAVLMSGTDRQFWRTQDKQCNHYYSMWKWRSTAPPTDHWEMTEGCAYTGWIEFLRSFELCFLTQMVWSSYLNVLFVGQHKKRNSFQNFTADHLLCMMGTKSFHIRHWFRPDQRSTRSSD